MLAFLTATRANPREYDYVDGAAIFRLHGDELEDTNRDVPDTIARMEARRLPEIEAEARHA